MVWSCCLKKVHGRLCDSGTPYERHKPRVTGNAKSAARKQHLTAAYTEACDPRPRSRHGLYSSAWISAAHRSRSKQRLFSYTSVLYEVDLQQDSKRYHPMLKTWTVPR